MLDRLQYTSPQTPNLECWKVVGSYPGVVNCRIDLLPKRARNLMPANWKLTRVFIVVVALPEAFWDSYKTLFPQSVCSQEVLVGASYYAY